MARQSSKPDNEPVTVESQRLDKWLWYARVAKTRTIAAGFVADGRVRVNRVRITKPAQIVKTGDVVTVSVAGGVRVLKILLGGTRRGPATEAALLYDELVPLPSTRRVPKHSGDEADVSDDVIVGEGQGGPVSDAGSGRPTKKDRRILDRLRDRSDD